jgi:PIN domain nuclease of toxin-antitoxin system
LPLPHGDQFDRIITATAKVHRLSLVTRDANITDAKVVPTIW